MIGWTYGNESSSNFQEPNIPNTQKNIIAGPKSSQYWNHSPPNQMPMVREEQPLPIQGNIGMLIKNEALNQYQNCTKDYPISGSPNCVDAFYPDTYTPTNTCGENCKMNAPESFGDKDFGFPEGSTKYTNSHGIHAYKNIRAGAAGQSSQSGCYEFIPRTTKSQSGTCLYNPQKVYQTVGDWTKLKETSYLVQSSWDNGTEPTSPPIPTSSMEPPSSSMEPPSSSMEPPSSYSY